jgi:hypothetical protein
MDVRRLDFTKLSEDDLIELNRRIVERLQLLRSAKSPAKLATFSVGMVVEFETEDGRTISGTVARLNQRTATVVAASGRWRVSPSLLRAAARRGIRRCDPPASLHCDRAESSARLAQIQELPEAVSRGRFSGRNIAGKLVLVERPPDGSEESRKFSREGGIIASRVGERHQFLADQVIECTLRAEASLDGLCRVALLNPHLLKPHARNIRLPAASVQSSRLTLGREFTFGRRTHQGSRALSASTRILAGRSRRGEATHSAT